MVGLVPQVCGPGGLVGTNNSGPLNPTTKFRHQVHFQASGLESFSPLDSEIAAYSQRRRAFPSQRCRFAFQAGSPDGNRVQLLGEYTAAEITPVCDFGHSRAVS
jgi:hypothetical protein